MTKFYEWPERTVDILVGGTPCQSFSAAGLRKGLDDPRGNLMLTYLAIAARYRPRWLVWENVPGVLSVDKGRAFGTMLGGLAELGYGFAYRVLDAQYFGVPQRRRRVFVVGYLGDWRRAAAVLFERQSLSGGTAPRREAGEGFASELAACLGASGRGFSRTGDSRGQDTLIAHTLRADSFDASEDGTGRGAPIVPIAIQERAVCENPDAGPGGVGVRTDGGAYSLEARSVPQAVAFDCKASGGHGFGVGAMSPPLRSMGHKDSHPNDGGQVAVAVALRGREGGATAECSDIPSALRASSGGGDKAHVLTAMKVRRLTPRECERLQGFPDDYTLIRYRGKPAADGPRYKVLGNSMAVPVIRWIGERMALVNSD